MHDWRDPSYLLRGSRLQRAAYRALVGVGVFERLGAFSPVLAGTIPLGIAVRGSDLDVLCHAPRPEGFEAAVRAAFGHLPGLVLERGETRATATTVARFGAHRFAIEIFGQPVPVERQYGYRHLLVEARLLEIGGRRVREGVIALKRAGMKTEPAFARVLGLEGDPYERLWELSWLSPAELRARVSASAPA